MRLLAIFTAVLLIAAVPASPVLAQDEDDEDLEEPEEDEQERSVEVENDEDGVSFELEKENNAREDKVEMAFEYEDASFEVEYESETDNRSVESKLEATFGALAEIRDENGNDRYDPGEPVVSAYALGEDEDAEIDTDGSADWEQATVSPIEADGQSGQKIVAPATFGDSGQFELVFYVFGDDVNLNGSSLSPTSAKIDIVIEDYPYQENDTIPALFMETEAENEIETDDDDDETGASSSSQLGDKEIQLAFTWKDTAQVDGMNQPVATTTLESETENETDEDERSVETKREFVLSYARGDEIVHDPKAEVSIQSASAYGAPAPGVALLAATGILTALAVANRRR